MKKSRIVIVGAGAVGSTTAYTLMLRNRVDELVLIDANHKKAVGDALDMNHGMPFLGGGDLWAGSYEDCKDADIIVITAGAAQREGESRVDLLKRNAVIIDSIVEQVLKYNTTGILLIASNPVDIMSYITWKKSGWPVERIIGSGTLLDSARFRYLIGEKLKIDPRSVHGHIVGEHGDSELPLWSLANVAGAELSLSDADKEEVFANTRDAAYQIISAKGATYYAIALALDRICTAILRDEGAVLNVSTLLHDYHGVSDVFLGVPCVVDRQGVREIIDIKISDFERELLHRSADKLRNLIASIGV
ncbi:L-lactate dehydrogenase [Cohnella sp. OV330]|uniref:L-lactate dehydrogenase n=1 Tax=Cohnella sp. OV330 TaxID=1855288 RepID=UPI0008E820E4|nr:L-lactate dehydrogenase [Cohnella sp. OV330]SFB21616.1 L-lactate dehydrogenase [Cohnella sp. OV330]